MVEITSREVKKHKNALASSHSSSGYHLREGEQNAQHNLREERKKEMKVCLDLVALNRSASSQ